jgi:hypothetical protein
VDETKDLGSDDYRWRKIYVKDIDMTGALALTSLTLSGTLQADIVNAITKYQINGADGINKSLTGFSGTPSFQTLNYKDHAGTNQTMVVLRQDTASVSTITATKGLVTA